MHSFWVYVHVGQSAGKAALGSQAFGSGFAGTLASSRVLQPPTPPPPFMGAGGLLTLPRWIPLPPALSIIPPPCPGAGQVLQLPTAGAVTRGQLPGGPVPGHAGVKGPQALHKKIHFVILGHSLRVEIFFVEALDTGTGGGGWKKNGRL